VRLVLLETPANPGLDVCDIRTVAAAAHHAGVLVAVDNTTATPLGQTPLDLAPTWWWRPVRRR
jgi:cystathionine gamma-lyase